MTQIVNITVNGQRVEAREGQTVLEAATAAGIKIPTLCHHPSLAPIGACRVCLIEISKNQPLHPACTYPVVEGLAVETHSPRVEQVRRFVVEMLFSERNHYCMYCEMSGRCELQDLGYLYGIDHWSYPTYTERFPVDATRDTFLMDHNRCVLCRRCVRACSDLVANHTLGMRQRGAHTMISADLNVPFGESSCVECGTCLQVCPTGALVDKRSAYMDLGHHVVLEKTRTVCSMCSLGCGMDIITRGGNVIRVEGTWDAPVNGGLLCRKGRFAPLYDGRQRLRTPMVRKDGKLESVGWDGAGSAVGRMLQGVAPGAVEVVASTHATNEALFLLMSVFRDGLQARTRLLNGFAERISGREASLAEIEASDLILVVGADPGEDQPVVSFLAKRRMDKGALLVVVDGTENVLAPLAHARFEPADIDRAIDIAGRADAPFVMYGPGLGDATMHALRKLERARFLALEPGVNTRAAVALGLNGSQRAERTQVRLVLLGDEGWRDTDSEGDDASLVVLASYRSPLSDRADVILPTAVWFERSGTLTNLEGRVQKAAQAVPAQGDALPDWKILSLLAQQLGLRPLDSLPELSALAQAVL